VSALTADEIAAIRKMLWEHDLAYPTREDGVESWADIAARLLATLDALLVSRAARPLEDALRTLATAGHFPLGDGYCARCGGACILPAAKENSEIIREAGYAKPSPFEPRTDWRERMFRHDDDDPA
jgi:hypothetical protein